MNPVILSDHFSLDMVDDLDLCCLVVRRCMEEHVRGHMDTHGYVSDFRDETTALAVGMPVSKDNEPVTVERGWTMFVARCRDGNVSWVQVSVEEPDVDAAVFACNKSGWSDDAIAEFCRGVTREEGYYLGYVLGVVSDIGVCSLETPYLAAINRLLRAARRLDFPELLEFLSKAYRGFAERRRADGEKDEATIKYEFSTALEAVGLKPATTK